MKENWHVVPAPLFMRLAGVVWSEEQLEARFAALLTVSPPNPQRSLPKRLQGKRRRTVPFGRT